MNPFYKKCCMFFIIFFLIFMFNSVFIPGCNSNNKQNNENSDKSINAQISLNEPKPVYNSNTENSEILKGFDKEIADLFNVPDDYEKLPLNSTELIDKAFNDGKITLEKASLLKIIADYEPLRLSNEYKSNQPADTCEYAIRYLVDNWDNLSKETQDQVLPYLLPINDNRSFFNPNNTNKKNSSTLKSFNKAYAATEDYEVYEDEFTYDGQKFEILYYESKKWPDKKRQSIKNMASKVKEALIFSWDKFKPLMKIKPTKPYVVEILELPETKWGQAFYFKGYNRIRINASLCDLEKHIKSTTAHELFHTFQFEFKLGYSMPEERWLSEATAVWSENYVYPDYNVEHCRHPGFFRTLDNDRIGYGKLFEYDSYMFFYYLTDYAGMNFIPEIIKTAGEMGSQSIRPFLDKNIKNIKETYGKFALYNWNWPPVDKYYDYGKIIGGPSGKSFKKKIMKTDEEDKVTVSLKPGALMYYLYMFNQKDPMLQHVTITFDKSIVEDKYLKRQAILRINGQWVVEDWSNVTVKEFCRAKTDKSEDIQALILIYSNANLKNELNDADKFTIKTGKCYKEVDLNLSFEYNLKSSDFEWNSKGSIKEKLEIKDHCYYIVKNSSYNFSGEGFSEGKKIVDTSGSFSVSINNPTINNSLVRVLKKPTENIQGLKETYEKYGIKENIPPNGIFVTVPALIEGISLKGNTTFYFPEPIGKVSLSDPLPLDGISQVIAVNLSMDDWNVKGLNISKEINVFNHKCPLTKSFLVDYDKITKQLNSIGNMQGMGNQIPNSKEMKEVNVITKAMIPGNKLKGSATLKIKVNAVYTKYYGE